MLVVCVAMEPVRRVLLGGHGGDAKGWVKIELVLHYASGYCLSMDKDDSEE